jgi:hypothetical protein
MSRVQEAVTAIRGYLDAHNATFPGCDQVVSIVVAVPPQPGQPATKVISLSAQDLVALTEFADLMIQSRSTPKREIPAPDPEKVHRRILTGALSEPHALCSGTGEDLVLTDDPADVDCTNCLALIKIHTDQR